MTRIAGVAMYWQGRVFSLPAPARHHDLIWKIHLAENQTDIAGLQGFVTDAGEFVTREKAACLAL